MAHEQHARPLQPLVRGGGEEAERDDVAPHQTGPVLVQIERVQPHRQQHAPPILVGNVDVVENGLVDKVEGFRCVEAAVAGQLPHRV